VPVTSWLLWTALYLGVHFLVYAIVLRGTVLLQTERAIFLYHFISAAGVAVVGGVITAVNPQSESLLGLAATVTFHGVYSLSFLELWSLTEGSYSLAILDRVDACGGALSFDELRGIGVQKRSARVSDLVRLALIRRCEDRFALTRVGAFVATALRAVVWLAGGRRAA
jgi:hypothetical protein